MQENLFYKTQSEKLHYLWLLPAMAIAFVLAKMIASGGVVTGGALIGIPIAVCFVIAVFLKPKLGLITFIFYCFTMPTLGKHIEGPQFGLGVDGLLILTWLGVIFHRGEKYRWRHLNNDLVWMAVCWFALTVLQIGNPERPNIQGWLQEMRSATLYWVLTVPLTIMVFNKKSDLYLFLDIIILLSLIGALYGMKQLYIGVDAAEQRWLDAGAKKTHVLFGKLRVFSYYAEAAQFGASQGQLAIMCIVLATGAHSIKRRIWYGVAGLFIFYGMLISGTRGAMGALVGGGLVFLILSKQTKILIAGAIIGGGFIGMLKYTSIGSNNDQIRRMRTSLDPNDPSLQMRLINQRILKDQLKTKPFGTGVGTIGQWGVTYNKHIYTAKIPPDSLYVKIWAMYGVIGLTIWLGMMLYILGKACGMIWNTRDPVLGNLMSSLAAGFAGILLCSYGNEVVNAMPSSIIAYISWGLLWIAPRFDTPLSVSAAAEIAKD
jgi:hypothetical protein